MKKLRVGVIGLGVGARHAAGYASHPQCEVAILCDRNPKKLDEFKGLYPSALLTADPARVLSDPTINLVSIASYDADHYGQVITALGNDKHVLVEKPMCVSRKEAEQINIHLRQRPKLVLSSHFPLRHTSRFQELIADVRAEKYGRLYSASVAYNYGRVEKIIGGWRSTAPYYSVVLDGGIHLIDLLLQITGERVVRVTGAGNKIVTANTVFRFDDCVHSILEFESGLLVSVISNFGIMTPHSHPVSVYGTKASFEHDLRGAWHYTSRDKNIKPEEIVTPYRQEKQGETSRIVHSFVEAVLNGTPPDVTSQQVFDSLAVGFAIDEAREKHQWVNVEYF